MSPKNERLIVTRSGDGLCCLLFYYSWKIILIHHERFH